MSNKKTTFANKIRELNPGQKLTEAGVTVERLANKDLAIQ